MTDESYDESYLDKKYFIDEEVYNCPFCNRNNLKYDLIHQYTFDWSKEKTCCVYFVECSSCENISMHLSYEELRKIHVYPSGGKSYSGKFRHDIDIDSMI